MSPPAVLRLTRRGAAWPADRDLAGPFCRCGKLRKENTLLELKADALMKELSFLKEMFLTHASEYRPRLNALLSCVR